jgi:catechol 2,3-dioxygenase-like lactoylglutathione lyase family enzyme
MNRRRIRAYQAREHQRLDEPLEGGIAMATVRVRYIVDDVDTAISFYTRHLGFGVELHPAPGFASLSRGNLRLLLNAPGAGGAGQAMPDGRRPEPGGWNRIQLEVRDLAGEVERMRDAGARFRNEIISGRGGKQILLEDPSGNPIELFEPPRD